ncbi:MAG: hypothetical protein P1P65_09010 [Treponema sp.]
MLKNFDDLTIVDDYMFCIVMEDPELCKELLTMMFKNKIGKIVRLSQQKPIENQIASKGVRPDIVVEDEYGKMYDIEMLFSDRHPVYRKMRSFKPRGGGTEICFLKIGGADTRN